MRCVRALRNLTSFLLLLALPGLAGAVSIQSGDILISGGNAQSTGIVRLLPDGSTQMVTPGLFGPIAVDRSSGRIYVMGPANGGSGLLEIDRSTGAARVIVQDSQLEIGPLTIGPDGMVYTINPNNTGTQRIFRIDPDTGAFQQVFVNQSPVGPVQGASFSGIAATPDGQLLLIADSSSFSPTGSGSIYLVDPSTGQASFVADPSELTYPHDLEVLPGGSIVSASVEPNCSANCWKTVILDPSTSGETVLDTDLLPSTPFDLELDGAGNLLVMGQTASGGRLTRVDLATGGQAVLGDQLSANAFYVAYVPEPTTLVLLALALVPGAGIAQSFAPRTATRPRA